MFSESVFGVLFCNAELSIDVSGKDNVPLMVVTFPVCPIVTPFEFVPKTKVVDESVVLIFVAVILVPLMFVAVIFPLKVLSSVKVFSESVFGMLFCNAELSIDVAGKDNVPLIVVIFPVCPIVTPLEFVPRTNVVDESVVLIFVAVMLVPLMLVAVIFLYRLQVRCGDGS